MREPEPPSAQGGAAEDPHAAREPRAAPRRALPLRAARSISYDELLSAGDGKPPALFAASRAAAPSVGAGGLQLKRVSLADGGRPAARGRRAVSHELGASCCGAEEEEAAEGGGGAALERQDDGVSPADADGARLPCEEAAPRGEREGAAEPRPDLPAVEEGEALPHAALPRLRSDLPAVGEGEAACGAPSPRRAKVTGLAEELEHSRQVSVRVLSLELGYAEQCVAATAREQRRLAEEAHAQLAVAQGELQQSRTALQQQVVENERLQQRVRALEDALSTEQERTQRLEDLAIETVLDTEGADGRGGKASTRQGGASSVEEWQTKRWHAKVPRPSQGTVCLTMPLTPDHDSKNDGVPAKPPMTKQGSMNNKSSATGRMGGTLRGLRRSLSFGGFEPRARMSSV